MSKNKFEMIYDCATHRIAGQTFRIPWPDNRKTEEWRFLTDGRIEYRVLREEFRVGASVWRPIDKNQVVAFHGGANFVDLIYVDPIGDALTLSAITHVVDGKMQPYFTTKAERVDVN